MKRKNNKSNYLMICIVSFVIISFIFGIYFYSRLKTETTEYNKEEIYDYLNNSYKNEVAPSYSPLYGLLNYSFNAIPSTMSIEALSTTRLFYSSQMNSSDVDNIYKGLFKMSKSEYLSNSRFVSSPVMNCYYYQNTLSKKINCDSICSKSTSELINHMRTTYGYVNVLPDDTKKYCLKNAIYPIEGDGYFVNLNTLKILFKNITGKELVYNSEIVNNKYVNYNAYLNTNSKILSDYIKEIKSINSVEERNGYLVASYTAITDNNKTLNGVVTLGVLLDTYYVVSNSINSGYYLQ